jgi:hypothetical protein
VSISQMDSSNIPPLRVTVTAIYTSETELE